MKNRNKIHLYHFLWFICLAFALIGVPLYFGYEHRFKALLLGFPFIAIGYYLLFKANKLMKIEKSRNAIPKGLPVNIAIEEAKKLERRKKEEMRWHEFWLWK